LCSNQVWFKINLKIKIKNGFDVKDIHTFRYYLQISGTATAIDIIKAQHIIYVSTY